MNLTPHPVSVHKDDNTIEVIPPSLPASRVKVRPGVQVSTVDGVAIHGPPDYGEIAHLPEPSEGTVFIVSQITALALASRGYHRPDVVFPGTGSHDMPLRDGRGALLAITRLVRVT